ncbi:MAG: 4-hydroxybutyrate CoA-transferase [Pseudohongiellaceae bacterium]|jgi:4-hydroxybutyrate CoA-transferase
MKIVSAEQAASAVKSGDRVYIHEASMVPVDLVSALTARAAELRDVEIVHLHTEGLAPYTAPEFSGQLRHNALFVGGNVRAAVADGRADFTPVFLSEIPLMFRDGTLPLDVAFVQVSPADAHGFCRLGLSVACARAAVENAALVVAELNPRVPVTSGDSCIHSSRIHLAVEVDRPLPASAPQPFGVTERSIAANVAELVPDGATLQMGIGKIPNAVLEALAQHNDLGVHTEMFSDGLVQLMETGVVNNRKKSRFHRRVVTSFAMGSERLHSFVDNNPIVEFHSSEIVNDPNEIGKQHLMTAINSAIQIDLSGQICADSVGEKIISGIGGQIDFVQGAARSPGGKSIMALPATAKRGTVSRIVAHLDPGAGVVTTRGHAQWVVTEYGAVNLRGRNLHDRAALLTSIAHPDFREQLSEASRQRFGR